jgi:hypothetical protein
MEIQESSHEQNYYDKPLKLGNLSYQFWQIKAGALIKFHSEAYFL